MKRIALRLLQVGDRFQFPGCSVIYTVTHRALYIARLYYKPEDFTGKARFQARTDGVNVFVNKLP